MEEIAMQDRGWPHFKDDRNFALSHIDSIPGLSTLRIAWCEKPKKMKKISILQFILHLRPSNQPETHAQCVSVDSPAIQTMAILEFKRGLSGHKQSTLTIWILHKPVKQALC